MAFTHLHVHTEYSLLDGAARIPDIVARAKELGMDSLAITDHGVMFGVIDFYKECKKQGIKPIIGCECYLAARTMADKEPDKDKYHGHLVLLAENEEGYHNLIKLVSKSFTEGYYYKPRIDKDLLRQHSKGIIALSACLAGRVQNKLLNGDYEGAKKEAMEMKDIMGEGNFFLELQDQGLPEEVEVNKSLLKLSKELDLDLVATNDVHYVLQEHAEAHDVLLAIQMATTVDDPNRMRFPNDQFYLKSEDEMRKIFAFAPEAIDNTAKIAERCNVEFKFGEYHLPEFVPPEGKTNSDYLTELCNSGLKERYGTVTEALQERLDYELDVIKTMGYVEYFLIVWDFINYAKTNGIMVGPGRGSAAGSIVAYCLRITDIDPIRYNLIFERFLNPERVSMPDIDIDFCIERREEVIDYVIRKYGKSNVSQIITFGTLKAKAAIRDVGRALNLAYAEADRVAKAIPNELKMTIDKALTMNADLREMYEGDARIAKVIDTAKALEGIPRHASTHAAGVVISKLPLDEYVPLYMSGDIVSTQFNMTTIEELGLLKMDFLGLRNLTVIRDALRLIKENTGEEIDFSKMEYDDPGVYEMISKGNTDGVFQLESAGITSFMKNLKPSCFEDVVAGISLYRPGPMDSIPTYIENKKNPEKIEYVTPHLAPILDVTYGCLVYQEQVMQIVRDLAGYSYGRSDLVRRAMSKKKRDVMLEEKEYFINGKLDENGNVEIEGCLRKGISKEAAESIFADMESFAEYAFNKSHAAAYAVVAYETAYLKHHYPVEFMAALMTSVMGEPTKIAKYIKNCKDMGIEVLPPSVNESNKGFSVVGNQIRFGLLGVKSVGEGAIEAIIEARNEYGNPKDIFQFISNIDVTRVNKKAVESLIKSGALDCLNENRAAHLAIYESLMESAQSEARRNSKDQLSLFSMFQDEMSQADTTIEFPDIENFNKEVLLAMEKEILGVYITDHPLNKYQESYETMVTATSEDLIQANEEPEVSSLKDRQDVIAGGMITEVKKFITKSNQQMAFVTLEDFYGQIDIVVFPKIFDKYRSILFEETCVYIKGTLSLRDDREPSILANTMVTMDDAEGIKTMKEESETGYDKYKKENKVPTNSYQRSRGKAPVKIKIDDDKDGTMLDKIEDILNKYPGDTNVIIYLPDGSLVGTKSGCGVRPTVPFAEEVADLVGNANVKIEVIAT